jgi:AraC-like DNA-binding protein
MQRPVRLAAGLWLVFGAATIIYILEGLNDQTQWLTRAPQIWMQFPGFMIVALFWMFTRALVQDDYRPASLDWGLMVLNAAMFVPICIFPSAASAIFKIAHLLLSLILIGDAMRIAITGLGDDLVESRRRTVRTLIVIIPVIGVVIAGFVVLETLNLDAPPVLLSGIMLVTLTAFTAAMSSLREDLISTSRKPRKTEESALPPADRIEIARLQKLMQDGVYLEPNLSIGALAARMNVPEHRLRRLINNHLGHRNFASFINDHRIDEARRRLADTGTAREQITGIAFDLGFASLAPFNRAFRERAGVSPTEYRAKALENALHASAVKPSGKLHS